MTKLRDNVALFLICTFLFVSVIGEFAHRHNLFGNGPASITKEAADSDGTSESQSQNLICVVCLFDLSRLTPDDSFQGFKPDQTAVSAIPKETTFTFFISPPPFYLRAPPAA
ncbi:hypothetical protein GWO43_04435 [candidate division KSB1 bacterium]|nr:hypothetical protein [candidate division KSB1 bacterium]NIR71105.1 hypothetical protein [candidate division KSB1 bacterium]NIS23265.1 hypothetical protein [candidate division KSB1 bacterium]NIT70145.1 hypothetical protein [candidate division KSB1 bacterium]NIU23795.1 hypothetical protein [candidate division KSB1 bacterium]